MRTVRQAVRGSSTEVKAAKKATGCRPGRFPALALQAARFGHHAVCSRADGAPFMHCLRCGAHTAWRKGLLFQPCAGPAALPPGRRRALAYLQAGRHPTTHAVLDKWTDKVDVSDDAWPERRTAAPKKPRVKVSLAQQSISTATRRRRNRDTRALELERDNFHPLAAAEEDRQARRREEENDRSEAEEKVLQKVRAEIAAHSSRLAETLTEERRLANMLAQALAAAEEGDVVDCPRCAAPILQSDERCASCDLCPTESGTVRLEGLAPQACAPCPVDLARNVKILQDLSVVHSCSPGPLLPAMRGAQRRTKLLKDTRATVDPREVAATKNQPFNGTSFLDLTMGGTAEEFHK